MGIVFWDSACVTPPHRTLWLQQGGWRKLQSSVLGSTGRRRRGRGEREGGGVGAQGISRYHAISLTTSKPCWRWQSGTEEGVPGAARRGWARKRRAVGLSWRLLQLTHKSAVHSGAYSCW